MKPESVTIKNIEAAFAGESMAHIKYMYSAKICHEQDDVETARVFGETAAQEVQHAFGHLDQLFPKTELTPAKAAKRSAALAKVGERHANHYCATLARVKAA